MEGLPRHIVKGKNVREQHEKQMYISILHSFINLTPPLKYIFFIRQAKYFFKCLQNFLPNYLIIKSKFYV